MLREELSLRKDAHIILGCGSIEPRKGTDIFVKVATLVPEAEFVWIGGSKDKAHRAQDEARGAENVYFIGSRESVIPYYQDADLFLLTSCEEALGLVVLEAAYHGKLPTVCFSDCGGTPEFVRDDAGICVPNFNVCLMADAVSQLLMSPKLRKLRGAIAHQSLRQFSVPAFQVNDSL
jgi:glycosyltransferase involved in cell wall biosynthesis